MYFTCIETYSRTKVLERERFIFLPDKHTFYICLVYDIVIARDRTLELTFTCTSPFFAIMLTIKMKSNRYQIYGLENPTYYLSEPT
mgnify:FL=1